MKELTIRELYTLDETIAKDLFEGLTYPWEALPKIKDFILKLGETLPEEEYEKVIASLSPEQEEAITKYCDAIFSSGADTEEFFYRLGLKDGLKLRKVIKVILKSLS